MEFEGRYLGTWVNSGLHGLPCRLFVLLLEMPLSIPCCMIDTTSDTTEGATRRNVERIGTRGEQGGQALPRRLPVYVAEVLAGPQHWPPPRPRSCAGVLGGVTAGGVVSSCGVYGNPR